jgi:repressor LexA
MIICEKCGHHFYPVKKLPPTKLQNEALEMIKEYIEANGFPPTFAEIGLKINKSPQNVARMIKELKQKNQIGNRPGKSRSLYIVTEHKAPSPEYVLPTNL